MNLKVLNKPKSSPLQKLACSSVETLKNPKYIKQTIKSLERIKLEYLFCHGCRNSRLLTSDFKASAAPAPTWEFTTFSMERCRFHFSRQRYEGVFLLLHHHDGLFFAHEAVVQRSSLGRVLVGSASQAHVSCETNGSLAVHPSRFLINHSVLDQCWISDHNSFNHLTPQIHGQQ